ncbi:MAG: glutaredoxin family protein [Planctomycetes bacterium]|nr:glutaredoxin family protein [Planctomycetota bacterium]
MAWSSVWQWLLGKPAQRPDLHIVLYTRADCPLCDEAWHMLADQQKRFGFVLEAKDVDADADLVREFGECVPVVVINGVVRFRGRINEVLLNRILDNASV